MSRSFTIEAVYNSSGKKLGNSGGRYISNTPSSAASKAFSQTLRTMPKVKALSLLIYVRETTQGSQHKTFAYRIRRTKQVTTVMINGEEITYKYTTKVKAV